jgi:hypothetical protein
MSCPACGGALAPGTSFCLVCGTPLGEGCSECGAVPPSGARYCPDCGARIEPPDDEPASLQAFVEPSTSANRRSENLEEFIARMRRMQHEQRSGVGAARAARARHRRVATVAAGVVAAVAVLLGATWLLLPGLQPSPSIRVATPTSVPGEALMPATARPEKTPGGDGAPVARSIVTRAAREVPTTVSEGKSPRPSAAVAEGTASEPARRPLPATETAPSHGERSEPTAEPPSTGRGASDREVAAHIQAEHLADGLTSYTARLYERDGRPVTGATVSIRGRRPDGEFAEATLIPEAEAGLYRAVVPFTVTEARLRIAGGGRVQEIPLPDLLS